MNKHARLLGLLLAFAAPLACTPPANARPFLCSAAEFYLENATNFGSTYTWWFMFWDDNCQG